MPSTATEPHMGDARGIGPDDVVVDGDEEIEGVLDAGVVGVVPIPLLDLVEVTCDVVGLLGLPPRLDIDKSRDRLDVVTLLLLAVDEERLMDDEVMNCVLLL